MTVFIIIKATLSYVIESFKPPLLKVGVRMNFPVYPMVKRARARHSNSDIKLPVTV